MDIQRRCSREMPILHVTFRCRDEAVAPRRAVQRAWVLLMMRSALGAGGAAVAARAAGCAVHEANVLGFLPPDWECRAFPVVAPTSERRRAQSTRFTMNTRLNASSCRRSASA